MLKGFMDKLLGGAAPNSRGKAIGGVALKAGVCDAYSKAAEDPEGTHPFPVGRRFAEEVGYPTELLDWLPSDCSAAFAGVSNVSFWAALPEGSKVLDIGCGSGLDAIVAAKRMGFRGHVTGVDFSQSMLNRARKAAKGLRNLEFLHSDAEDLPFQADSFNVVLANGILNLNPNRSRVLAEIYRVLVPGGRLYASELVLISSAPAKAVCTLDDWFSWVGGALKGDALLREFAEAGFREVEKLRTFRSSRTRNPEVLCMDIAAQKPA